MGNTQRSPILPPSLRSLGKISDPSVTTSTCSCNISPPGPGGKLWPFTVAAADAESRTAPCTEFGFRKVEILPGNIGYLDFRFFANAGDGGPTAIAAMNFLAHTDALIFDLRQNGGGNPSMIQLISSYLFEEPVHLNSFYIRKGDSTQQFWTQELVDHRR